MIHKHLNGTISIKSPSLSAIVLHLYTDLLSNNINIFHCLRLLIDTIQIDKMFSPRPGIARTTI